jgi:HK97 family phage portal protein
VSESRILSDIVWTPERGLSVPAEPEVRSLYWNQALSGDEFFGGRWQTESEVRITPETAIQSTVVLAACRILAETIASLPIHVYRRTDDGYKELARDIPLYKVLSFAPNEWQTKFEFFEQMVMNLTLWGNSYSLIRSGKYGAVSSLDNLHPSRMDVERLENGRLRYSYMNPETGRYERYSQDNIMHVRWTSEPDGIKGMVPVEVGREAIGLARACEIHAAKYWANNAKPGIVLQTDGTLSPEAAERLRDNWERLHRGVDKAWKTCVLTNGLKAEQIGFNAEQSQFESTRRFQSEEIARIYRLPLHLIQGQGGGDLETSGQEFVTYTLVPWLRRIESAISRSLIYNDDIFFAEFDARALMRGNSNSRAAYYSTMMNLGILSVNEVRRFENLAPLGKEADNHFVGMNMQTLEQAAEPKDQQQPGMPPAEVPGSPPSLPEVKTGKAPMPSPKGEGSEKKEDEPLVEYAEGKTGRVKHVMEQGTLDLKSGEKIEVEPGKPVALVVDEETGEEVGVEASKLKPAEEKRALTPQSEALYEAHEEIAEKKGRWSQADAHYMIRNPFAGRGIACRNCIHFEEDGSCEIVKGQIAPTAICKLWVIPPEKLSIPESRDCGRDESGRFGSGNKCQDEGDGSSDPPAGGGKSPPPPPPGDGDSVYAQIPDSQPRLPSTQRIDIEKLLEKISQSPDGFSLDPLSAEQPTSGIMVSEFPNDSRRSVKISANDIKSTEVGMKFGQWISDNADLLGTDPSRFIGGWKTGDDFYIDVATRFEPTQAESALEAGRKAGQLAVFNLETFKETWVQYEPSDTRKPKEWDGAFARARKDSQVKQVYDPDSPDLQDEDHASELAKHGKKTVRSYTDLLQEITNHATEAAEIRCADIREEHPGDVPHDEGLLREGSGSEGRETRSGLVRRRARQDALALQRCRRLIKAAGGKIPLPARVEIRDIVSLSMAEYDFGSDTLYVSPNIVSMDGEGWVSQSNPVLHELGHRFHAMADGDSYTTAADVSFTPEQRSLIESEVSRYAATNGREFVAEVLAGHAAGKKYSDEIRSLLVDIGSIRL